MIILGTNSIKATGFDVANSVRFNRGDSAYMHKTPSSAGNVDVWTFSAWIKVAETGGHRNIFAQTGGSATSQRAYILLNSSGQLYVSQYTGSASNFQLVPNRLLRDESAWYHIVVAVDTTQGTDTNRLKLYINGVQETSFESTTYPSQNLDTYVNAANQPMAVGYDPKVSSRHFGGYMAEVVLIDGQQLAADQFGEFDSDSGIWKPIDVSGLTFGTNGFYLNFEDSSNLGNDANGGTDLTEVNLAATDQSTDTCTLNYALLNPLIPGTNYTWSEGNLQFAQSSSNWDTVYSSIGVTKGKWYMEFKGKAGSYYDIGVTDVVDPTNNLSVNTGGVAWKSNSEFAQGGNVGNGLPSNVTSPASNTYTANDIIGIALDVDNEAVYFRKNGGDWEVNSDPTSGSSKTGAVTLPNSNSTYFFAFAAFGSPATAQVNFGGGSVDAISSGNTDGNGYGNFEYAVPSGYFSLNTKNLSEFG